MATWKKKHDPQLILDRLEDGRIASRGGKIKFKGFSFAEYGFLLSGMLDLDNSIGEDGRRFILNSAIFEVAKSGPVRKDQLIAEISKLEARFLKKQKKRYRLLTELSVSQSSNFPSFSVERTRITFSPKLSALCWKKRDEIASDARDYTLLASLPRHYTPLTVSISARTFSEAAETALDRLDYLRGLLNFGLNQRWRYRSTGGKREPVNKLVLGPVHTLHKNDGQLATQTWWYEPQYHGALKPLTLRNSQIDALCRFVKLTRKQLAKCEYRRNLVNIIIRYVRALDLVDWEDSFIRLWSIMETLTSTTYDGYKVTIRRTAFLFNNPDYVSEVLTQLKNYRNRAIHAGSTTEDIEAIMFRTKWYVERLLVFHITNAGRFDTTEEAGRFLDTPWDVSELSRQIELLRFAIKFRG